MSFNLFGPPTKDDIRVGYIHPTLGYIDDVTICEANNYAKDNPGTTFIFKDGNNNIQYLNINEVNNLDPNNLFATEEDCGGIQNYSDCSPPKIQIYGGGGVGAVANPIIGQDGSLLGVDIVSGGHGYQYPPLVNLVDNCNIGNGAVLTAVLGETPDQIEVYEGEEDFEEYEICDDTEIGYGIKYGIDGEELGDWDPTDYTRIGRDPIEREIEAFQKAIEKPFWTTRKYQPDRIIVSGEQYATQETTEVNDSRWGEFMNLYAVSPVKPSDTVGTDEAGKIFQMEWEYNFPVSGEYIFRGVCDNVGQVYIDNSLVGDLKSFADNPSPLQKTIQEGNHIIRIDLLNVPSTKDVKTTTTAKTSLKAKFIQKGSSYYLQVDGTGSGEIFFVMDVNDSPYIAGLAAKEIRIPSDGKKVKFVRTEGLNSVNAKNQTIGQSTFVAGNYPTEETIKESGTFTGGNLYGPIEIIGADPAARGPISISKDGSNKFSLRDADGNDENIKITIEKIKGKTTSTIEVGKVVSPKSWKENPLGVSMLIEAPTPPIPKENLPIPEGECPPNPIWTTRFPNSRQQWYPVNFPGPRTVTETVTENVSSDKQEVEFNVYGEGAFKDIFFTFTSVDGNHSFTINGADKNKKTRKEKIQILKNVNYVVKAKEDSSKYISVEQGLIKGSTKDKEKGIGSSNKIFADYLTSGNDNDDIQITASSGKFVSSNRRKAKNSDRNTFDLTYTLESSSQSTLTTTKTFDVPGWSSFMNRYAISPVPPLNTPGSDTSGVLFSNSWEIDLPYSGFYGIKATGDNTGRVLIDGVEISRLENFSVEDPKLFKVSLFKGRHTITTEITNRPVNITSSIDTKIFSTQDWRANSSNTPTNLKANFIQKGSSYYLQVDGTGSGEISFVMDVNDASYIAGLAAKEIRIPSDNKKVKFVRTEGLNSVNAKNQTIGQSTFVSGNYPVEETIKESGTFTGGNLYGPIEIIGADPAARGPIPIKGFSNKFSLRDADGDDENIKITIEKIKATTSAVPPTSQSPTKNGVTYSGPSLTGYSDSKWSKFMNEVSVSPSPVNNVGKVTLTWKNVDFPQDGTYKFNFQADNIANLTIGGTKIYTTTDFVGDKVQYTFNITSGKYDVVIDLENIENPRGNNADNPRGVALYISKDISFSDSNKTPWTENPIGVSAILIPPPCAKKIGGKGVVEKIIPFEPGNGYLQSSGPGYPVILVLDQVIVENPGINYTCGEDQIKIVPDNGVQLSYKCGSFGQIVEVIVENPGNPFTVYPSITIETPPGRFPTGVNAKFRPVFRVVRDPLQYLANQQIKQEALIQVTDLVGLKQTGYVDGRAYYGAIYYDNGVPYAGYYKTAGTQVRVYNTLQESITAMVTTPPSAIQRSGTDIRSNDPLLNIPGTPQSTTEQQ